jgi:2-iminobutanoate/2-iminopropanoate deaminase
MQPRLVIIVLLIFALAAPVLTLAKDRKHEAKPIVISTKDAPPAAGSYSQAIVAGGFVYVSGQVPRDPGTNKMVEGDISTQTDRVMKNIEAILAAAGSRMDNVVRTTVYLKNVSDFAKMNAVYGSYFKSNPPARSTVGVDLPAPGALVEIDAVALK